MLSRTYPSEWEAPETAGKRKVRIVGIVASGKTTLARQLSAHTGIDWHELDEIVHARIAQGSRKRTTEEQMDAIRVIDHTGAWIFEGTDRDSHADLYEMADLIIFLDPPLWQRRIRIVKRWIRQNTGREPAPYKPDFAMLLAMFRWTNEFERGRPAFEAKLTRYGKKVLRITNDTGLKRLLEDRDFILEKEVNKRRDILGE